jgi:hypothetical protein
MVRWRPQRYSNIPAKRKMDDPPTAIPTISPVDSAGFGVEAAVGRAVAVEVLVAEVEKVAEGALGAVSRGKFWPGLIINVAFLA